MITLNNRGYLKIHLRDFAGALIDFRRALEIAPDNVGPITSMAELLIAQGSYDAAFEWIERALATDAEVARKAMRESADYDPIRGDARFVALLEE